MGLPRNDSLDATLEHVPARTRVEPPSGEPPPVAAVDGSLGPVDADFAARYQLRRVIGEGGMGEVRLCRDERVGREVALKVVRDGQGSHPDQRSRFLREARIQGQLEHPSVVPVYDLGRDPDGQPFFTMKRIRGFTLADVVEKLRAGDPAALQQYSRRKLLTAFSNICLCVDYAHARGVLHRDLKPSNVMLGDFGEVYVLDWGLAKLAATTEPARGDDATVVDPSLPADARTAAGAVMGTPGYMPPEQARGDLDRLDARSDVYALGAILFELLALEPLHAQSTLAAVVASTIEGVDARPSLRAPAADVPPELDRACVRATALEPDERFASARDLSEAVERFLDGDRDLALRRHLAEERAADAAFLVERAVDGDNDARARAMAAVGRALALDPSNGNALASLSRLMTTPPREHPAEVRRELDEAARREHHTGARLLALGYFSWFLYLPFAFFMGVRDVGVFAATVAIWVVSAAVAWFVSLRADERASPSLTVTCLSMVAIASTAMLVGPFLLVPPMAAVHTVAFLLAPERRHRVLTVALGCLAITVPVGLELVGVLPPSFTFRDGGMVILPRMIGLPSTVTPIFILVTALAVVITASVMIARFRDAMTAAEERMIVMSWQLRQLFPAQVPSPPAPSRNAGECSILP